MGVVAEVRKKCPREDCDGVGTMQTRGFGPCDIDLDDLEGLTSRFDPDELQGLYNHLVQDDEFWCKTCNKSFRLNQDQAQREKVAKLLFRCGQK